MTKQISGTIFDLSGAPVANAVCTVTPLDDLVGQDGGARVKNTRTYSANGSGVLTISAIEIGRYAFVAFVPVTPLTAQTVARQGVMRITADTPDFATLEQALETNAEPLTPALVQQAIDASLTAQAAAAQSVALQTAIQIRPVVGNRTAQLIDAGHLLTFSGAATLTIPAQSSVAWPAGTVIAAAQLGAATLTISGAAGVTIVAAGPATITQGLGVTLIRTAENQWLALGDFPS